MKGKLFSEIKMFIWVWPVMMALGFIALSCSDDCISCGNEKTTKDLAVLHQDLDGEHDLRKIKNEKTGDEAFFVVIPSERSDLFSSPSPLMLAHFSWKMNDKTYIVTHLPLEAIYVNFNKEAKTPTIKFDHRGELPLGPADAGTPIQSLINGYVRSATVTIRESDWEIRLPTEQGPLK